MRKISQEKRNKRNPFRFIYSPKMFALLGVVILFVISIPLARSLTQKYKVEGEINDIKAEINKLQSKNKNLDNLVKYLQSDQFLEEQARMNFDLKKKGEKVVVVKEEGKVAGVSTSSAGVVNKDGSREKDNPEKWMSYFFEE